MPPDTNGKAPDSARFLLVPAPGGKPLGINQSPLPAFGLGGGFCALLASPVPMSLDSFITFKWPEWTVDLINRGDTPLELAGVMLEFPTYYEEPDFEDDEPSWPYPVRREMPPGITSRPPPMIMIQPGEWQTVVIEGRDLDGGEGYLIVKYRMDSDTPFREERIQIVDRINPRGS